MEDSVSNSKLYMLRCIIAMAHADGIITDSEIAYISAILNRLPLTGEQREILEGDFTSAQKVEDLIPHINDPNFRAQVSYFARLMAYKDGHLHPSEQEMLDKIHALTSGGLDMDQIRAEVKKATDDEMLLHDIQIQNERPMRGKHFIPWFQILDEILLKLGIDLLK